MTPSSDIDRTVLLGPGEKDSKIRRSPCRSTRRLGHTSTRVTLDTYGHLFLALDEALTKDLGEQFQNAIFEISQPARGLRKLPLSA